MPRVDASSRHPQPKQPASGKPSAASSGLALAKQIAGPALLLLIVFAVYSPSLKFDFILDDHRFTADPRIQEPGHIFEYFSSYVWAQFTGGPPSFYRPVFLLWLRLNFVLSELSPWGWHFLSIAKHLLVGVALWLLIYKLLSDRAVAFAGAALFLLHPSHTESVSWVTVPDPLLTLGLLLSLFFYLKFVDGFGTGEPAPTRKSRKGNGPVREPSGLWFVASLAAYFAALSAKETAIVFPMVILVIALSASESQLTGKVQSRTNRTDTPRRALIHLAWFAVVTLLYLLLRWNALAGNLAAATQHLPWSTIVLSWPATLWFYVKAILWPVGSYSFADPDLISSFTVRDVLLPLVGLICCAGALSALLAWAWKTAQARLDESKAAKIRFGLLAGMLLLVLPLLLTLNLNALNPGDFLHGRYVYLSLAGLSILVAIALHLAHKLRLVLFGIVGLVAIAFVACTWSQERQWKDDSSVFTIAHQLAPHNRPVAQHLADTRVKAALVIADEGRCDEAMPVFDEVNREFPDDWYTWAGRGICFVHANDLVRAEESLHRAADLSHDPTVIQQWQALRAHMGLSNSIPSPSN